MRVCREWDQLLCSRVLGWVPFGIVWRSSRVAAIVGGITLSSSLTVTLSKALALKETCI
jgi:hypothetical protein